MTMTPLIQQLLSRMAEQDLKPKSLADRAGLNETAVRDIIKGRSRNPRIDTLEKLARALGCTTAELTGKAQPGVAPIELNAVVVRGAVAAGIWRDAIEWDFDDQYAVSAPPDSRFPGVERFGLEVRGNSMDRVYPEGTIIICIRFMDLGALPSNGDRVVCIRRNEEGLVEATVKEFVIDNNQRAWLWPRSSQPEFQQPWPLLADDLPISGDLNDIPATVHAGIMEIGEGPEPAVQIAALVTGSYRRE